jgi:hypothetical protein
VFVCLLACLFVSSFGCALVRLCVCLLVCTTLAKYDPFVTKTRRLGLHDEFEIVMATIAMRLPESGWWWWGMGFATPP